MTTVIYSYETRGLEHEDVTTFFMKSKHAVLWEDCRGRWHCGHWTLSFNEALAVLEGVVKLPTKSEITEAVQRTGRYHGWAEQVNADFARFIES